MSNIVKTCKSYKNYKLTRLSCEVLVENVNVHIKEFSL